MSAEHSHRLSTSASCISSTMSIDDTQFLSTSSATCIATAMSLNDIQILSTSPALSNSTSSNTNGSSCFPFSNTYSSSSSSSNTSGSPSLTNTNNSSSFLSNSSERIFYLLKHEKHKYDTVDNKVSSAVASYWFVFGFPGKLNKQTGNFKRIMGCTSCHKYKKTFVYGPNSGNIYMKQHLCVIDSNMKISTQTPIDKIMLVHKTLSDEQSNIIKDLIEGPRENRTSSYSQKF